MSNRIRSLRSKFIFGCALCLSLLVGCAAQPPTHYYDLTPQTPGQTQRLEHAITLGVGPVTLPKLLDRPGIVTRHDQHGVKVANYHVWAGDLESAFTRVIAENLALQLSLETVWAFPWDNRFRPQYQLRIFVERFSGELNGEVVLNLSWTLLDNYGQQVIGTHRYRAALHSEGGYMGYVSTLNQLLADFANDVGASLAMELAR